MIERLALLTSTTAATARTIPRIAGIGRQDAVAGAISYLWWEFPGKRFRGNVFCFGLNPLPCYFDPAIEPWQ